MKIRDEITEQIEYRPSLFFRRQIIRPVYASRERAHALIVAALPAQVIPQSGVGPGFLTHTVIAKYCECRYRHSAYHAASGTMPQNSVENSKTAGFTRVYSIERSA